MPDHVSTKPVVTESPLSLELELEIQHVNDDLDNLSVVPDDDLQFDSSDKIRNGSDSAIGDVYSNGNSSTIISKEIDESHMSSDLKLDDILMDKLDDEQLERLDGQRNELISENLALSIEQPDNLSSSPSWNLDLEQTPEPEFPSLSTQSDLNSMENPCQIPLGTEFVQDIPGSDTINASFSIDYTNNSVPHNEPSTQANNNIGINTTAIEYNDSFDEDNDIQFNADFGEFATFDNVNTIETIDKNPHSISTSNRISPTLPNLNEQCDNNEIVFDDDNDDEFGEFSDFQQMSTVQTVHTPATHNDVITDANVLLDSENIKLNLSSILNNIFPNHGNCDVISGNQSENVSYDKKQFINNLTAQLRNVENSNALNHQWAKSTSKTVLVKALGIDSRNIVSNLFNYNLFFQ